MKLFAIKSMRLQGDKENEHTEFVVADHIQKVIDYCALDLKDEAVEIQSISDQVPITKIL